MTSSLKKQTGTKRRASSKLQLTEEQQSDIKEAFKLFDSEDTDSIKIKDLKVALRALGIIPNKEELKKIMHKINLNGTGKITLDEFTHIIASKMSEKDETDEILKAFNLFDTDNSGKITLEDLKRVAQEIGEKLTDRELEEMINEADRDGDGEINQEEFLRIMKKTCLYHK